MRSFDVQALAQADPDVVWRLLAHGRSWPRWAPVDAVDEARSSGLVDQGSDEVGAVRAFRTGRVVTGERVTVMEPGTRLVYEDAFNPALRDYRAEVTLTPRPEGGTLIRWRGRYTAKWCLGWYMGPFMQRFMQNMVDGLAAGAGDGTQGSLGDPSA